MSAVANQNQLVTVTVGWREPNGQVIQFGGGPGSAGPAPAPVATSSGSSFSGGGSEQRPAGSNAVDLFA